MKPILVLFATREGHTRRIAEYLDVAIRDRGRTASLREVRNIREPFDLGRYQAAILAASVHMGSHESEIVEFVKRHRDELAMIPSSFLSVSLGQATADDTNRTGEERAKAIAEVQRVIHRFLGDSGWHPKRVQPVAGALLYTKYSFILRFVMKRIARRASMTTDTSRDHEFTDWKALDRFADEVVADRGTTASSQDTPALA